MSSSGPLSEFPDVDMQIFDQITSLDDDQTTFSFTRQLLSQFYDQAEETLSTMKDLV
jgi:hypothetical protein